MMKAKILIPLICLVIILGGAGIYWFSQQPYPKTETHTHAHRGDFPTLEQLSSVDNFVSRMASPEVAATEYVHSEDNYKQTTEGSSIVTILHKGKVYAQAGDHKAERAVRNAVSDDMPTLYGYAQSLNKLFDNQDVTAKHIGTCELAEQAGNKWKITTGPGGNEANSMEYVVCTAKKGGYLLGLDQGINLGTDQEKLKLSFTLTSVGDVPVYTPDDL